MADLLQLDLFRQPAATAVMVDQEIAPSPQLPAQPIPVAVDIEAPFGRDLFGRPIQVGNDGALNERFVLPPFSVLDARQGYWQDRRRAWFALGFDPLAGLPTDSPPFTGIEGIEQWRGPCATFKDAQGRGIHASIFDPVLAEFIYRWFAPHGGTVLDPFAGECTKGIVAAGCGLRYTGLELRQEQVAANAAQAAKLGLNPVWIVGDAARLDSLLPQGVLYDLIFTSPPYYDLEMYGGGGSDASAFATYKDFYSWCVSVFSQAACRLADNRFLVIKVGEIRDEEGFYRNFVGDTIEIMRCCGLHFYNEAILITPVGTLPVRTDQHFRKYRKLGKGHQNILFFYKGDDPRRIAQDYPEGGQYEIFEISAQAAPSRGDQSILP